MRKLFVVFMLLFACRAQGDRITAAEKLTDLWAEKHPSYRLVATAAGDDCRVLLIFVRTTLDDAMVEAFQYGGGKYEVTEGGILGYARDMQFRGIAYRDEYSQWWVTGDVHRKPKTHEELGGARKMTQDEADETLGRMLVCR